jgi:transposase
MRNGITFSLSPADRERLRGIVSAPLSPQKHVWRARIILLSSDGLGTSAIMAATGKSKTCVWRWQERFMHEGVDGLLRDKTRPPGRAPVPPDRVAQIVRLTQDPPPHEATHWTARAMAKAVGLAVSTVQSIWKAHGLAPHRWRSFKLSNDPAFAEKLHDIVGLYVSPPAHAVVLSFDEKSQIQALDRTQPGLPMKKGRAGTMTHDYKRHGTTTLFAALNGLDGQVIGQCQQRHTHVEWLKFLKKIDRETPKNKTLHLIADNYATHKHPVVQEWLAKHPRFHMHFTPTSASWLNMVERFFRDITTERLRRGVFTSVPELIGAIDEYIAHHNTQPKPFIWTKSARDILQKVIRANRRLSSKQNATLH